MNIKLWGIIVSINASLSVLRNTGASVTFTNIELVTLRSDLRAQLEQLRNAITEQYSE